MSRSEPTHSLSLSVSLSLLRLSLQLEREEAFRKKLFQVTQMVFKALCTDPDTGLPIDPRVIFRRLDTDGGGTVDIDEFRHGLEVCGCELNDEELEMVWQEIDGAAGESDGQVDHEVLVTKLKEVNDAQLKLMQPKLVQVLFDRSTAAMIKVQREAERAQKSRSALKGHRLPQRQYAFDKGSGAATKTLTIDTSYGEESDCFNESMDSTAASLASTLPTRRGCHTKAGSPSYRAAGSHQQQIASPHSTGMSPARMLHRGLTFARSHTQGMLYDPATDPAFRAAVGAH